MIIICFQYQASSLCRLLASADYHDAFSIKLAASAVLYLFYDYNNDAFSIKLAASAVLCLFYDYNNDAFSIKLAASAVLCYSTVLVL